MAKIDNAVIGSEVSVSKKVKIKTQLSSPLNIRRVCLVRDGEYLNWVKVDAKQISLDLTDIDPIPGRHWYMVTAEADSQYPDPPVLGHASPFFVNIK